MILTVEKTTDGRVVVSDDDLFVYGVSDDLCAAFRDYRQSVDEFCEMSELYRDDNPASEIHADKAARFRERVRTCFEKIKLQSTMEGKTNGIKGNH